MRAEEGLVGIVRREHDGDAAGRERLDVAQHADPVSEVEVGRRLVHHEDPGLLGERAGDQRELSLASADLRVAAVPQAVDSQGDERAGGHGLGRHSGEGLHE